MVQGLGNNLAVQNSISNFNKIFDQHLQNIDKSFEQVSLQNFDDILAQKNLEAQIHMASPIRGGIQINAGNVNIPNLDMSLTQDVKIQPKSEVERALGNFGEGFADGIRSINQKELEAEHAVETLASGGDISVHEVMIAAEKANLSMQMGLQLRNKILAAYNELYNVKI
ncbi:flagellar hook-basal body complex protein FliE [bacterium]|nr:flagellar hook-basal body complex protein FliE [bacterium]